MSDKETGFDSERTKVLAVAILVEVGLFLADGFGLDIEPETIQTIATAIAGLVGSWIIGRSYRNK